MTLDQNGVVLKFSAPKRRRFGSIRFFFQILPITKRRRFGQKKGPKRRRFEEELTYPKRRRFELVGAASKRRRFEPVSLQNDVILLFI